MLPDHCVDPFEAMCVSHLVFLCRSGRVLPAAASATAASAASVTAAARRASSSPWLSTMASLMSTPTSSGVEGHGRTLVSVYLTVFPGYPPTVLPLLYSLRNKLKHEEGVDA